MQEVLLIINIYLTMLGEAPLGRSFGIGQKFGYDLCGKEEQLWI